MRGQSVNRKNNLLEMGHCRQRKIARRSRSPPRTVDRLLSQGSSSAEQEFENDENGVFNVSFDDLSPTTGLACDEDAEVHCAGKGAREDFFTLAAASPVPSFPRDMASACDRLHIPPAVRSEGAQ